FLTIIGISIGIASITTILALSSGVTNMLHKQTEAIGKDIALIRPATKTTNLIDLGNPTPTTSFSTSPITEHDLELISELPGIKSAAPLMTLSGSVHTSDERPRQSTILATTPEFSDISNLKLEEGQFIDSVTLENTAILGEQLAINLFGTDQAVGKTFILKGQRFTCIGVAKRQNTPINYNNIDLDNTVIISFESGKLFNQGVAQIQQINVQIEPSANVATVRKVITKTLEVNHDGEQDTTILTGNDVAKPTSRQFTSVQMMMTLIAGISLLVGGIGIMNIMLVSVAERTREIGLRKAVGASNASIITQFMIEALITSLLGGLLGYLGGYLLAYIISMFLPYDPAFTWNIAALAAGLSVGIGVIFGLYPAIRAARKNPIESLRRLH
ncbi:MAG TPA: ABC transporter permease, partial [Candidatus Saccharimonadales bacterium]